jgi:hypothetical protein
VSTDDDVDDDTDEVEVKPEVKVEAVAEPQAPPGLNLIKLFSSSLMTRPNKLEGLPLETLSSQVLEFEGKARANPIGGPFRCFLLG